MKENMMKFARTAIFFAATATTTGIRSKSSTSSSLLQRHIWNFASYRYYTINRPTAQHIVGVKRPERPKFFDADGISLHYEIAVPDDFDFLLEWELEHAMYPRFTPVPASGDMTRDDVVDYFSGSVKRGVESGCSLLGFDGNTLVVMALNLVIQTPTTNYTQLTDDQLPYNKLKDDYQADIDNGPYKSAKANAVHAFLHALDEDVHLAFLPGSRALDLGRPTLVHKDYRRKGRGLGTQLLALRMGKELLNCSFVYARMAVGKTSQMGQKMIQAEPEAAKIFRVIRYDDFRASGKPVFSDAAGTTEAMLIFADYKKIKNVI